MNDSHFGYKPKFFKKTTQIPQPTMAEPQCKGWEKM
jgi:hypothetical protein